MSVPPPKRRLDDMEAFDEKADKVPGHTVIVSTVGDQRPDEVVPDSVAAFFLNLRRSVTTYVVVPLFAPEPVFLANWSARDGQRPVYRYVKKMVPDTAHLRGITCDVMVLWGHGSERIERGIKRPHCVSFFEADSVCADGTAWKGLGGKPQEARIWSCSVYVDAGTGEVYTSAYPGVVLSEVVRHSKLVLLLACCSAPILREYSSEAGAKTDFVVLSSEDITHDVSNHVLLGLLATSLEDDRDSMLGGWHDVMRRHVCQVLLWVKQHGDTADEWWAFLQQRDVIRAGHVRGSDAFYRVRVHAHSYLREADDKDTVWRELKALTLKIWHAGDEAFERGYVDIHAGEAEGDLLALKQGRLAFANYRNRAAGATLPRAAGSSAPADVGALLVQLRALAARDGPA